MGVYWRKVGGWGWSTIYVWEAYIESWGVVMDGGSKRVGGGGAQKGW